MMNHKNDLSHLCSFQGLQWQSENSPRSTANIHSVNNNKIVVLQRRVNRRTQDFTLLTACCVLNRMHGDLDVDLFLA